MAGGYIPVDTPPGTAPLPLGKAAPAPVGSRTGAPKSAPPAKSAVGKKGSRPIRVPKGKR